MYPFTALSLVPLWILLSFVLRNTIQTTEIITHPYLGGIRLIKYSAQADDNSAPEAATWQHHRQDLPSDPKA